MERTKTHRGIEGARYEPEIHEVAELVGISLNVAEKGEMVNVLQSAFFSSYDDDHRRYFEQILGQFSSLGGSMPNDLLIVIRNKKAQVHTSFPVTVSIRSKGTIQQGRAVFKEQILDIEEVRFRDDFFEADIQDGDKIVWLFRVDWSFGLYFDLSGKLSTRELWKTLGQCFRTMHFHEVYAFFVDPANPERLIDRGWFPFIQFSTDEFRQLRHGISEPSELNAVEAHIVQAFSADRIDEISEGWWNNPAFRDKKEIIAAGLNAYKEGSAEQAINCIKNLVSEAEGIIRLHFHQNMGRRPTTRELMVYVSERGRKAFPSSGSLAFPDLFFEYLENYLFRGFDLTAGSVEISRHSVAHGVAAPNHYTRTGALQVILALDQIHHYIMSGSNQALD
ncbi:MAG: hypothetical protein F4Y00_10145 [Bacteroidetes bacterium SB0662_bin_6]|nr:hypothetical protein [Bacteroidetes bacterium SB0662_bin_6]